MLRFPTFLLCILCGSLSAAELDLPRFLPALRMVEDFRGRDGARRERGPYQFRESTWRQHMPGVPFARAREEGPARACAVKHVEWLRRQLRAAGCDDGAYMVALCWNAGLSRTLAGRAHERSYDYARRVENLYQAQKGPAVAGGAGGTVRLPLVLEPAEHLLQAAFRLLRHSDEAAAFGREEATVFLDECFMAPVGEQAVNGEHILDGVDEFGDIRLGIAAAAS